MKTVRHAKCESQCRISIQTPGERSTVVRPRDRCSRRDPSGWPTLRAALWIGLLLTLAAPTHAVPAAPEERCPGGNLLLGIAPVQTDEAEGVESPELLNDGVAVLEGDSWDSIWAARFDDTKSAVRFDLEFPTRLRLLTVQADGNDRYQVELSHDAVTWRALDPIQTSQESGLRERSGIFDEKFRHLRIRPVSGDGNFSISEISAFCRIPSSRPEIIIRKTPQPPDRPLRQLQNAWGKMALLVLAFVVLVLQPRREAPGDELTRNRIATGVSLFAAGGALIWTLGFALAAAVSLVILVAGRVWQQKTKWAQPSRTIASLGLIVASICAWTNFGFFSGHYVHYHDAFHYYIGSKYSDEIGYSNLYRCTAVADAEDLGSDVVAQRQIRDLATKARRPGGDVLADPGLCKKAFESARWQTFKQDVAVFRGAMPAAAWNTIFLDHGYNPTPLWSAIGGALSFDDALTESKLLLLTLIDPLLYALALLALAWAFGVTTCAVTAVVWATGMPWDFMWTGGGYARSLWLVAVLASIALAKKNRLAGSGAALAFSSLLRIFPVFMFTGPLFAMLGRAGPPDVFQKRFILGGVLGGVILLVGSAILVGPDSYRDFVVNIHAHSKQPTQNQMGLPTLLAWHPERTAIQSYDFALTEPRAPWAANKETTLNERAPIHLAVVLAVIVGLWVGSRRLETWKLICLGSVLVGVGTELSNYYFVILVAIAPLAAERVARYGVLMLGVFLTQFVPIVIGLNYEAPYVFSSAVVLAVQLLIGADVVMEARRTGRVAITVETSPAPLARPV
jgi:hypothetical protein